MAINKMIVKLVGVGVAGLAAGTTGGIIFASKRCRKKSEEKIKAMQDKMTELAAKLEAATINSVVNKVVDKEEREEEETADNAEEGPASKPQATHPLRRRSKKVYEIDEGEFIYFEGVREYYTYYALSDILADVNNNVVDDEWREDILGDIDLDDRDEEMVYIRSDNIGRVFCIEIESDVEYGWGEDEED